MTYEDYLHLKDKAGITDYRVAKDLRLGNAFFYKWRTRAINPRKYTLDRIADYLRELSNAN